MINKVKLNNFDIDKRAFVSVKEMGNVIELCYKQKRNSKINIKLLNKNEYINLETGEILQCSHIKDRSENKFQVSQTLKRLRDYINTNVTEPNNWKWITLTYGENMTDTKTLKADFNNFMKKVKRKYKDYDIEYIVCAEPQGRGAWHMHLLLSFGRLAPFVPNADIEKLWAKGFTTTRKVDNNIDNIGAYLTAYLGDLELTDENIKELERQGADIKHLEIKVIKENEVIYKTESEETEKPKKFIKGARLYMYPPKFNIYRISKGIKKPKKSYTFYYKALKKVGHREPTYKSTYSITDNKEYSDIISYEYYNIKREKRQIATDTPTPKERLTHDKFEKSLTRIENSSRVKQNKSFVYCMQI